MATIEQLCYICNLGAVHNLKSFDSIERCLKP